MDCGIDFNAVRHFDPTHSLSTVFIIVAFNLADPCITTVSILTTIKELFFPPNRLERSFAITKNVTCFLLKQRVFVPLLS